MAEAMRPGDTFADRYRLVVLLHERSGGRFWRAWDNVLARHVALHVIATDDPRAPLLQEAARRSATVQDPHLLRVLDTDVCDGQCYVVNEWGEGTSLNHLVYDEPLTPLRAAWLVSEVAQMVASGHAQGVAHGRLVPENVLLDTGGSVKVIGFAVDAALHGLPPGRESTDLTDLAGLLHTALTGRWAGVSISQVPMAPVEHGRPLRPRQVRAGVPRMLDAVCEDVLSGGGQIRTVRDLHAALLEYVGDPAAVAQAESDRAHGLTSPRIPRVEEPLHDTSSLPATPPVEEVAPPLVEEVAQRPSRNQEGPAADADEGEATQVALTPAEETQAGAPVFYDDLGEVGWQSPAAAVPPPPPPFEEPPERPLFAPDPPGGRPNRLPPQSDDSSGFWPFGGETAHQPAVGGPRLPAEPVPGRSWLRVAGVIVVLLLVLVASIWAFNRGNDAGDGNGGNGFDSPSSSDPAATGTVIAGVSADDYDPFGGPDGEYPALTRNAVDGKPGTSWVTSTYQQQFGPGGLKPGVGLVLDLGSDREVGSVTVQLKGSTTVELRTSSTATPASLDQTDVVATETGDGRVTLTPDDPVATRYLVVWLTEIPRTTGGFRGEVVDVEVRG